MKRALLPLLAWALLCPSPVLAQEPSAPPLSLQQAIERALSSNPSLAASAEGVRQARASRDKAFALIQPTVRMSSQYRRNDREVSFDPSAAFGGGTADLVGPIYGNFGVIYESLFNAGMLDTDDCAEIAAVNGFSDCDELMEAFAAGGGLGGVEAPDPGSAGPVVIQPIEQFFVTADVSWPLSPRVVSLARAGNQQIKAAVADTLAQRDQLLGVVIQTYARTLQTQEAATLTSAQAERAAAHVADTQQLFDEGVVTRDALLQAQLQLARTDLQNRSILQQSESARRSLAIQMGASLPDFGSVEPIPEISLPEVDSEGWGVRALASRPEIASAEARARAAKELEIDAFLQMIPAFSLSANWRWSDQASGFDSKQSSWWVGVGASVPLWDGGLMIHGAREAASRKRQAKLLARATRQRIQAEVRDAHSAWIYATGAVPVAQLERDLSAELYRLAKARYQDGSARQLEVMLSLGALQSAELGLLKSEVEARLAAAALLAAGGGLDEWLGTIP